MQPQNNKKRSRSSNWSESEKSLLTRLIKEKVHLIENKDVSKNNNQIKKAAWKEILESYNQLSQTPRDMAQLLNQWRNTKNTVKKRNFEYKRSRNATGGGPPPASPPPEDMEIIEMIPNEFEVDDNVFDSDYKNNTKKDINDSDATKKKVELVNLELHQPSSSKVELVNMEVNQPSNSSLVLMEDTPIQVQTPVPEGRKFMPHGINFDSPVCHPGPEKRKLQNVKKLKKQVTTSTSEGKQLFNLAKKNREQQFHYLQEQHKKKMELMETEHKNTIRKSEIMEIEHKLRMEILKKESEFWQSKLK